MKRSVRKTTLNTLVEEKTLSPEGKNWFIEAVDPFHDDKITLSGFPDMNVSSSVVQCIKQTATLTAETSAVGTGNWDAHIVMWPFPVQNGASNLPQLYNTSDDYNRMSVLQKAVGTGITPYHMGGLTTFCVASGQQTYGSSALSSSIQQNVSVGIDSEFLEGSVRIIGMGFEVVNTTADIYKQGQVIVYRQPMPTPDTQFTAGFTSATALKQSCTDCVKDTSCKSCGSSKDDENSSIEKRVGALPADLGYATTYAFQSPPTLPADALLLEGSAQWGAREGVYCVSTQNTMENPAKTLAPVVLASFADDWLSTGGAGQVICTPLSVVSGTTSLLAPIRCQYISPFNLSGAYFTGLSTQTSLTITATWYVERFPTARERNLAVLASPSPAYDDAAYELYARSIKFLPVGVMQGENPLGEWFGNVLDAVRDYAVPIGKAVGLAVPGVGAISSGVEAAINAVHPKKQAQATARAAEAVPKRQRKQRKKMEAGRASSPNVRPGPGRKQGRAA